MSRSLTKNARAAVKNLKQLRLDLRARVAATAHRRRLPVIAKGARSAQASPAGVARPVAVTETHFPMFKLSVPFISSGCGAAVGRPAQKVLQD
jgi:hypothetical protein